MATDQMTEKNTPTYVLWIVGAFRYCGLEMSKSAEKKTGPVAITLLVLLALAYPAYYATQLYFKAKAQVAEELKRPAPITLKLEIPGFPEDSEWVESWKQKDDARIINVKEVAWLQKKLIRARNEGLVLPKNTQKNAIEEVAWAAFKIIRTETTNRGWPKTDEEVWTRKSGDTADKAFFVAITLLREGFREVGIRLGVDKNYQLKTPLRAWVVVYLPDGELIVDAAATEKVYKGEDSPLKNYDVVATILATSVDETSLPKPIPNPNDDIKDPKMKKPEVPPAPKAPATTPPKPEPKPAIPQGAGPASKIS